MEEKRKPGIWKTALVIFLNIPLAILFYFLSLVFFMGRGIHDGDTISMVVLIMILGFSLQLLIVYRIIKYFLVVRNGAFFLCLAGGLLGWIVATVGFWMFYFR